MANEHFGPRNPEIERSISTQLAPMSTESKQKSARSRRDTRDLSDPPQVLISCVFIDCRAGTGYTLLMIDYFTIATFAMLGCGVYLH